MVAFVKLTYQAKLQLLFLVGFPSAITCL